MEKQYCECGNRLEHTHPEREKCNDCIEEEAKKAIAKMEPPEDGWRKNSDMDRL